MKTLEINTPRELNKFVKSNRKDITNINGVEFTEMYPILELSNNRVSYYNVEEGENSRLYSPFKVLVKEQN